MSQLHIRYGRLFPACFAVLIGVTAAIADTGIARAQSGSRLPTTRANVALEGYCPVCVIEMKKWVRGNPQHKAAYDGKTYYFPSDKQRQMFVADPAKFVPALGGDCVVCYANLGKRVPGNIRHAALHDNRLFLFPSDEQQKEFVAHAAKYADADLALNGNCAVCRTALNKDVPGNREIAALYQGLRYLFPSEKERDTFLANPTKYAVKSAGNNQASTATAGAELATVDGMSGCAACDHGVVPIGSPSELGLAVNSTDGNVYVVEGAHKLYPDVYEKRFEGLPLEVSGKVVKRDGKFIWMQPSQLKIVN